MKRLHHSLLTAIVVLTVGLAPVVSQASEGELTVEHIEPMGDLYTQVVAVEANGIRTLYLSGQVGGGATLEEQSKGAYGSLKRLLEANGATVDNIVKLVTYVVDWNYDKRDATFTGFYEIFAGGAETTPAHTLVGVKALYSPNALIEVEAIAVLATD